MIGLSRPLSLSLLTPIFPEAWHYYGSKGRGSKLFPVFILLIPETLQLKLARRTISFYSPTDYQ
jgi:hypothetical protein